MAAQETNDFTRGAITALSLNNQASHFLGLDNRKRVITQHSKQFVDRRIRIQHSICDIYNPIDIRVINPSSDFKLNTFTIYVEQRTVSKIYFDLCEKIIPNTVQRMTINQDEMVVYKIPMEFYKLNDVLSLIGLIYSPIEFVVHFDGNCESITLNSSTTFLNDAERREIARGGWTKPIILTSKFNVDVTSYQQPTNHNTITLLPLNCIANGIFFNNLEYSQIDNIELKLNNLSYLKLDLFAFRTIIKKITDNCFYLPFDMNSDYTNLNIHTSINFSAINSNLIQLIISTRTPVPNFQIYVDYHNVFECHQGMGHNSFNYMSAESNILVGAPINAGSPIVTVQSRKLGGDKTCPVTYNDIDENDKYTYCSRCKKNFSENVFEWIITKKSCPMCRNKWLTLTSYVNKT